MAAKIWNPKKQGKLVKLYESKKYSVQEIADQLCVSYPTIYNRLRLLGWDSKSLPRRYRGPGKIDFSGAERQNIIAWKQEGCFRPI